MVLRLTIDRLVACRAEREFAALGGAFDDASSSVKRARAVPAWMADGHGPRRAPVARARRKRRGGKRGDTRRQAASAASHAARAARATALPHTGALVDDVGAAAALLARDASNCYQVGLVIQSMVMQLEEHAAVCAAYMNDVYPSHMAQLQQEAAAAGRQPVTCVRSSPCGGQRCCFHPDAVKRRWKAAAASLDMDQPGRHILLSSLPSRPRPGALPCPCFGCCDVRARTATSAAPLMTLLGNLCSSRYPDGCGDSRCCRLVRQRRSGDLDPGALAGGGAAWR